MRMFQNELSADKILGREHLAPVEENKFLGFAARPIACIQLDIRIQYRCIISTCLSVLQLNGIQLTEGNLLKGSTAYLLLNLTALHRKRRPRHVDIADVLRFLRCIALLCYIWNNIEIICVTSSMEHAVLLCSIHILRYLPCNMYSQHKHKRYTRE